MDERNEEVLITKGQLLDILIDYFGTERVVSVYDSVLNSIEHQQHLNEQNNG